MLRLDYRQAQELEPDSHLFACPTNTITGSHLIGRVTAPQPCLALFPVQQGPVIISQTKPHEIIPLKYIHVALINFLFDIAIKNGHHSHQLAL